MRDRSGFTLVEVMVAMVLLVMVGTLAHQTLGAVTDGVQRAENAALENDRLGNRYAWMVGVVGSVVVGSSPNRGFAGVNGETGGVESDYLDFFSRGRFSRGVTLVQIGRRGAELVAVVTPIEGSRPDTLVVADSIVAFGADYLLDYGADSRWVSEWVSPVSAPVALRLRYLFQSGQADTLLLHMGIRG